MNKTKKYFRDFVWITLATVLTAIGIYFFKFPNNFSTGGVTGLAVILARLVPTFTAVNYSTAINLLFLIFGFAILGKEFGIKTLYASLLQTVLVQSFELLCPLREPLTNQPMLELLFVILLAAIGSAILFDYESSSGGTDIIAMVIKKYSSVNISKALFCVDALIVMVNFFVFGIENWLFSLIAFAAKIFVLNNVIKSIHLSKFCTVVIKPEFLKDVCDYITHELKRTATVSEHFKGAFGHEERSVLLVALSARQTMQLKKIVKSLDAQGFVIATDTSEISGRGFRDMI